MGDNMWGELQNRELGENILRVGINGELHMLRNNMME